MQEELTFRSNLGTIRANLSPSAYAIFFALQEIKEKVYDEFRQLVEYSPLLLAKPVRDKFGWLIVSPANPKFNTIKLELFHDFLINFRYIPPDLTYKEFEEHFFGLQTPDEKIKWIGKICALAILFDKLHRKEIITFSGNIYDMLVVHFKDSEGKKIKRDSLERLASRGISASEERKIDKIVSYLSC